MYKLKKKEDIDEKKFTKEKNILILMIFVTIVLLISSSYAILTNYDETNEIITFKTGNLNMSVQADTINLAGKLPESDESGLLNSEPIIINLINTGTMEIRKYDVKLVEGLDNVSTLDESCIKYAISLDEGATYTEPNILINSNNIIHTGYFLKTGESKKIYLKVWIDEASGNLALNKIYYGSIQVDLYQKGNIYLKDLVLNEINSRIDSNNNLKVALKDTNGTIYISGKADDYNAATNDDIDFNYVWYSGKLWRIISLTKDGSMKLVTENLLTSIYWGSNTTYSTSWIREWLNQEFLPTLYNPENTLITDYNWNATITSSYEQKPVETTLVSDAVGTLNAYEYYQTYKILGTNSTAYSAGYLKLNYYWWLLNPNTASNVYRVNTNGLVANNIPSSGGSGVRPAINLKSSVLFESGDGSYENPYTISEDKEKIKKNITLLNERLSGEYVKIENKTYSTDVFRIIGTEKVNGNLTTKLVLDEYLKENGTLIKKYFSTDSTYGDGDTESYADYFLNNNYLATLNNNLLEKGTYYLGISGSATTYKTTVCSSVNSNISIRDCIENKTIVSNIWNGYVGLLREGEMFSSHSKAYNSSDYHYWLITPYNASYVRFISYIDGSIKYYSQTPPLTTYGLRPTINIKSNVIVKSGNGTKKDPFIIGFVS